MIPDTFRGCGRVGTSPGVSRKGAEIAEEKGNKVTGDRNMSYTAEQLYRARRRTEEVRALRGVSERFARSGRHALQVDPIAFFNAVNANGGVSKDGKTVWDDSEYVADMKRRHPEIDPCPDKGIVRGLVCRHGRVKERTYYRPDGKVTVTR